MRKQTLYDFLKKERRQAISNIASERAKRKDELVAETLDKRVSVDGENYLSVREILKDVYAKISYLCGNVIKDDLEKDVFAESRLRSIAFNYSKPEDFIGVRSSNFRSNSDKRLKELASAEIEVATTFKQLEEIVKRNTSKRACELLKEIGMEVPEEEDAVSLLPAIQVDLSQFNKWRGKSDENE